MSLAYLEEPEEALPIPILTRPLREEAEGGLVSAISAFDALASLLPLTLGALPLLPRNLWPLALFWLSASMFQGHLGKLEWSLTIFLLTRPLCEDEEEGWLATDIGEPDALASLLALSLRPLALFGMVACM